MALGSTAARAGAARSAARSFLLRQEGGDGARFFGALAFWMALGVFLVDGALLADFFLPAFCGRGVCSSSSLGEVKRPLLARGLTLLGFFDRMVAFMVVVTGEDGAGDGVLDVSRWYGTVASSMSFCNMARAVRGLFDRGDVEKMHAGAGFVPDSRVVKLRAWWCGRFVWSVLLNEIFEGGVERRRQTT